MKMNSQGHFSEASTMGMGCDNPDARGVSSVRNAQKKGPIRGSTAAFVSSQHTGGSVGKGGNAETLSNDLESYHKKLQSQVSPDKQNSDCIVDPRTL